MTRMFIVAAAALAVGAEADHRPATAKRTDPVELGGPVLQGDEAIAARVQDRIAEAVRPPREVSVVVSGGVVVLRGFVTTLRAHRQVIDIAQATRGVRAIVDELRVLPVVKRDHQLAREVRVALAGQAAIDEQKLKVRAQRGTVFLAGVVGSAAAAHAAWLAAASVAGARRIDDALVVLPDPHPGDLALARDIRFVLSRYPLGLRRLDVSVHGGVARLYGKVGSAEEKARAAELAALDGVRAVHADSVLVDARLREPWVLAPGRPADEALQDAVLVALMLDGVRPDVEVAVHDGVATLSGRVATPEAQARILALAAAVVDVREVIDELTPLGPGRARAFDLRLERLARDRVAARTRYPTRIRVHDRVAVVDGAPRSRPAQRALKDALYDIAGIREVIVHLDAPAPPTT